MVVLGAFYLLSDKSETTVNIVPTQTPTQVSVNLGQQFTLGEFFLNDNRATTSITHLTTTATSTIIIKTESANLVDLNFEVTSSSTNPTLVWDLEFSSGNCNTVQTQALLRTCNLDFHGEDGKTITSNVTVTHGDRSPSNIWTSSTSTQDEIRKRNVAIDPVASRFMRVNIGVTGAPVDLWVQAVLREPTN